MFHKTLVDGQMVKDNGEKKKKEQVLSAITT